MHPRNALLTALFLFLLLGSAVALPNLKVNWVQYSLAAEKVVAEIQNDSGEKVEGFAVSFFADGEQIFIYSLEEGPVLEPGSTIRIGTEFPLDERNHQFIVIADSLNQVHESNESDNTGMEKISLSEPTGHSLITGGIGRDNGESATSFYDRILLALIMLLVFMIAVYVVVKAVTKKYA